METTHAPSSLQTEASPHSSPTRISPSTHSKLARSHTLSPMQTFSLTSQSSLLKQPGTMHAPSRQTLPSSQASPSAAPSQASGSRSMRQSAEQPSPSMLFPSSHSSLLSTMPLPQYGPSEISSSPQATRETKIDRSKSPRHLQSIIFMTTLQHHNGAKPTYTLTWTY